MAAAKVGEYRCEPKLDYWSVHGEWNDGNGCVAKCQELAKDHGGGCCEARRRDYGAYCRFGNAFVKGWPETKAVICKGNA